MPHEKSLFRGLWNIHIQIKLRDLFGIIWNENAVRARAAQVPNLDNYAFLSPDDLRQVSSQFDRDITGCKDMRADEPQFSNNDGTVTVIVRSQSTEDADWTVTCQALTYTQKELAK